MMAIRTYFIKTIALSAILILPATVAFADLPTPVAPDTLTSWVSKTTDTVRHVAVYPKAARGLAHEGSPEMRITVDRQGRVLKVLLAKTSGHNDLDCAADNLVQSLSFPALPEGFTRDKLTFSVAINYDLMSLND